MAEIFKVIILGIVEGITEWLPISSTGHMILVDEFIKLNVSDAFMEMFRVVIQLGAILAVCVLYFHKLNPFSGKKSPKEKKETFSLWGKVIVGCIPAAVIGLPLDDKLDALFYNAQTVAFTLILYGILFIVVENYNKKRRVSRGMFITNKGIKINADINGSLNILRKYIKKSSPNQEIAMDNGREQRPLKKNVA